MQSATCMVGPIFLTMCCKRSMPTWCSIHQHEQSRYFSVITSTAASFKISSRPPDRLLQEISRSRMPEG